MSCQHSDSFFCFLSLSPEVFQASWTVKSSLAAKVRTKKEEEEEKAVDFVSFVAAGRSNGGQALKKLFLLFEDTHVFGMTDCQTVTHHANGC